MGSKRYWYTMYVVTLNGIKSPCSTRQQRTVRFAVNNCIPNMWYFVHFSSNSAVHSRYDLLIWFEVLELGSHGE